MEQGTKGKQNLSLKTWEMWKKSKNCNTAKIKKEIKGEINDKETTLRHET